VRDKCEKCSRPGKEVYHYGMCPYEAMLERANGMYIWLKDSERPIEKADRYLRQSGLERQGAKGWL